MFDKLKDIVVGKGAKLLGGLLPGGGAAVSLVADLFGGDPDDPESLAELISKDPNAALKLRQLELDNKVELQKLALARERLQHEDRADARAREVAIRNTGQRDWMMMFVGIVVSTAFMGALGAAVFMTFPDTNSRVIFMFVGAVISEFRGIVSYYYGSTKSSGDKTNMLFNSRRS